MYKSQHVEVLIYISIINNKFCIPHINTLECQGLARHSKSMEFKSEN
ncbi:hypothetical protein IFVP136_C230883 [Vibrio parahaemolyticus]